MKKLVMAVAAIAAVALSGTAMAESTNAKIRKVDTENNLLTLKNGFRFHYGDDVNEAELTPDSFAKVTYRRNKDGQLEATKVVVKKAGD